MDLEYTVTETVTTLDGSVIEINYDFDEVTTESVKRGISTKQERRNRSYSANVTRQQYDSLVRRTPGQRTSPGQGRFPPATD